MHPSTFRHDPDLDLLTDLHAPPDVAEARESVDFWRARTRTRDKRKRDEAQAMLATAERRYRRALLAQDAPQGPVARAYAEWHEPVHAVPGVPTRMSPERRAMELARLEAGRAARHGGDLARRGARLGMALLVLSLVAGAVLLAVLVGILVVTETSVAELIEAIANLLILFGGGD